MERGGSSECVCRDAELDQTSTEPGWSLPGGFSTVAMNAKVIASGSCRPEAVIREIAS